MSVGEPSGSSNAKDTATYNFTAGGSSTFNRGNFSNVSGNQTNNYNRSNNNDWFLDIKRAIGATFNADKACLDDTRLRAIKDVSTWADDKSESACSICWVQGVVGCGKTSLLNSVALKHYNLGRLGTSFYFDASKQAERAPLLLFPTISVELALKNEEWGNALAEVLKKAPQLKDTPSFKMQFTEFILKPASAIKNSEPIIIIIDALDEAGDTEGRNPLLDVLGKMPSELPKNLRILISSRKESDILYAFGRKPHVHQMALDSTYRNSIDRDIERFVIHRLKRVADDLSKEWPHGSWATKLVSKSGGLFQWAATACNYVDRDGKYVWEAPKRLKLVLDSEAPKLDSLYLNILENLFPYSEMEIRQDFFLVMGRILAVTEPLPVTALAALHAEGESIQTARGIIETMGSLLSVVSESEKSSPIRLAHASFREFLMSKERSGEFWVDTTRQNEKIALAAMRVMREELRFNILGLETSYISNKDVGNLSSRVESRISVQLLYACRRWSHHVAFCTTNTTMEDNITRFFTENFLFWLEVMSAVGRIGNSISDISSTKDWLEGSNEPLKTTITQATEFLNQFSAPIAKSIPHIYLSAMPLAHKNGDLLGNYKTRYPRTLSFTAHSQATEDGILATRIWNSTTGQIGGSLLRGHSSCVNSIGFSPDGTHIVSGSQDGSIRIWNSTTGEATGSPLWGHSKRINSVVFSPSSNHLVSASDDNTIRVWDMSKVTDTSLHPTFKDSSRISPDGWILGPVDELIIWIPPKYRLNLWRPSNTCVIGPSALQLHLSNFVCGKEWIWCQKPLI